MKYLNKSFTVSGLKEEDWERIFGEEHKDRAHKLRDKGSKGIKKRRRETSRVY